MKTTLLLVCLACSAAAEPRAMSLKQAVALAMQQSPDLLLARLDEQKAQLEVQAVKEPALPRLMVGSGLAYSSGMPMSIDGASPSVVQAKAVRSLWNPQQGYQVAQAKESARAATLQTAAVREDLALRVATLFLDLERTGKAHELASRQLENLQRVEAAVRLRVDEGRELPIEAKRSAANVARARSRIGSLQAARAAYSRSLAVVLGLNPAEEITPAPEQRPPLPVGLDVAEVLEGASRNDHEVRKLESELAAKNLEVKSIRAARLPRVDLVAQYGLLAKFNNYEDYFNRFQRHNGQLGASIQIPVFTNSADEARAAQSEVDARRIRTSLVQARSRIEADVRRRWDRIQEAGASLEVARMDLDVAREQVSIVLAQMEEGRATLRQLEEARFQEQERWLQFYDAGYLLELARMELLHRASSLLASLR